MYIVHLERKALLCKHDLLVYMAHFICHHFLKRLFTQTFLINNFNQQNSATYPSSLITSLSIGYYAVFFFLHFGSIGFFVCLFVSNTTPIVMNELR